jgi:hypothetical protein
MAGVLSYSVPAGIALAKAAVGLSSAAILQLTLLRVPPLEARGDSVLTGRWFRAAAVVLVTLPLFGAWQAGLASSLPVDPSTAAFGLLVMGMGGLEVAVAADVIERCCGLLMALLGFEVLYTPLEPSLALVSLLAAVHVGLSLAAGYFWTKKTGAAEEDPAR